MKTLFPLGKRFARYDPQVHLEAPQNGSVPDAFIFHESTGPLEPMQVNEDGYLRYVERFPVRVIDSPIAGRTTVLDTPVDLPNSTFSSYSSAKFLGWTQHRIIRARLGLVPMSATSIQMAVGMALVLAEDAVPQASTLYDVSSIKSGTVGPCWAPNWTDWVQCAPHQGMGKMVSGSWYDNATSAGTADDGTALPPTRQLRMIIVTQPQSTASTFAPGICMLFMEAEFWVRQATAGPLVGVGLHSSGTNANLNLGTVNTDGYLNLDKRDALGGPWGLPPEDEGVFVAPGDSTASRGGSGTYNVPEGQQFESNRFDSITATTGLEGKSSYQAGTSIEAQAYDWLCPYQRDRVVLNPERFIARHGDVNLNVVDVGDVDGIVVFIADEDPAPPGPVSEERPLREINREAAYQKMLNHLFFRRGLRGPQLLGASDPVNPNGVGDWIQKAWAVSKKVATAGVTVAKALVHSNTFTNAAASVAKAAFSAYAPAASALWYTVNKADTLRTVIHAAATVVAKAPGDVKDHVINIPVLSTSSVYTEPTKLQLCPEVLDALRKKEDEFEEVPVSPPIISVAPSQRLIATLTAQKRI